MRGEKIAHFARTSRKEYGVPGQSGEYLHAGRWIRDGKREAIYGRKLVACRGRERKTERERENRPPPLILPSVSLCRTIVLE